MKLSNVYSLRSRLTSLERGLGTRHFALYLFAPSPLSADSLGFLLRLIGQSGGIARELSPTFRAAVHSREFYLLMNILVILRGVCLPVDNDDLDSETEHLFEGFGRGCQGICL